MWKVDISIRVFHIAVANADIGKSEMSFVIPLISGCATV